MPAFIGLVRFDSRPLGESDKAALAHIAQGWAGSAVSCETPHALFWQTRDAGRQEDESARSGLLFAGMAFVHNPQEVSVELGLRRQSDHATLVRTAFEARGDQGLAAIRGAFSFASWNETTRELTLARDCGHGKSLYFHRTANFALFASHLPSLLSHPAVPRDLDETVIASFAGHDTYQHRSTFFRGVERVPPRHTARIAASGISVRPYWAPHIRDRPLYRRDEDYIEKGRELLDHAVGRSVADAPKFAVMASGGLDSSAILSTLARSSRSPIRCYTIIPDEASSALMRANRYADERPKTEALKKMYPALEFEYLTASQLDDGTDIDRFERSGTPYKNASRSRFGNRLRGRIAADGFDVILGGGAGNFGLTWHGADLLPFLARHGRAITLLREARHTARQEKSSVAQILAHELVLPSLPLAPRRAIKRLRGQDAFSLYGNTPLRRDVIGEFDLENVWQADGFDPAFAWPSTSPKKRSHWLFDRPLLMHDNPSASPVFADAELRAPLGDRDLLEFALNVPATLYRRNGVKRWFARQVLADRVPAEILHERRRGSLPLPWFDSLNARRAEIAAEVERMENSIMASRIFDIPRLKKLAEDWPRDAEAAQAHADAYMLSLEQAVHIFQFMRWATKGNV